MMIMKLSHYIKCFKNKSVRKKLLWSTKWMSDLIGDDDLMEKYNTIWDKVSADIKKKKYLIANLSTIKKKLTTKIIYGGDEATVFHDEEISKVGSNHIY